MNTSSAEFLATKANKDSANTNAVAAPPEMIGAEMLVHALHKEGVEYVWGYPGGSVLFIYDEIFKQDKFEHILVRHEQAAVHAADGYARATGKVGVALVTSGPGVTNAVTLEVSTSDGPNPDGRPSLPTRELDPSDLVAKPARRISDQGGHRVTDREPVCGLLRVDAALADSTSCMMCEEKRIVFFSPSFFITSLISMIWLGSKPEVGSSKIKTSGSCMSAAARPTRCLYPLLSCEIFL